MGSEVERRGDLETTGDKPVRPRRRRRLVAVALVVMAGFVIYLVVRRQPPVVEAVSPDGKYLVRFLAAGVGSIDYRPDSVPYLALYKFAQSYLPVVLFRRLPAPQNVQYLGQPTPSGAPPLFLLFDIRPLDPATTGRSFVLNETMYTFDEQSGYPLVPNNTHRIVTGPGEIVSVDNFPRRDRQITVRLIERASAKAFLTATFPNPAPATPSKEWVAEALPITLSSPELHCTLTGFRGRDSKPGGEPQVMVEAKSAAWSKYEVTNVLEDATGNSGHSLSPFEPVWKVVTQVHRTVESEFEADELWKSPAFPVPGEKQVANLGMPGETGGTTITLLGVKGVGEGDIQVVDGRAVFGDGSGNRSISRPGPIPGSVRFTNLPSDRTNLPYVLLQLENLRESEDVFVRIVDQDGEVVGNAINRLVRLDDDFGQAAVQFKPRETTREVSVTVIVSRPQVFEFYAEPPAELRAKYVKAISK